MAARESDASISEGCMVKHWLEMSMDMMLLGMEAQRVVGLRLAKLASGGVAARTEAQLMFTEKAAAFAEAATTIAVGGSPGKVIRRYRSHVRANEKRLSRPLPAKGRLR
jgi:hypothetical protein